MSRHRLDNDLAALAEFQAGQGACTDHVQMCVDRVREHCECLRDEIGEHESPYEHDDGESAESVVASHTAEISNVEGHVEALTKRIAALEKKAAKAATAAKPATKTTTKKKTGRK